MLPWRGVGLGFHRFRSHRRFRRPAYAVASVVGRGGLPSSLAIRTELWLLRIRRALNPTRSTPRLRVRRSPLVTAPMNLDSRLRCEIVKWYRAGRILSRMPNIASRQGNSNSEQICRVSESSFKLLTDMQYWPTAPLVMPPWHSIVGAMR